MPVAKRTPLPTWTDHVVQWKDCHQCPLGDQRSSIVLARGTVPCDVLFIGEAPGTSEDAMGVPFVETAPAGNLMNQIIERALHKSITYALTNIVACFPREAKMFSNNHQPTPDEIRACRPRLTEFVNIARPRLVVRVGQLATAWVDYVSGVRYVDIIHPSYILVRMPLAQRQMAVNKSIVVIRSAVEDMVESNCREFTNWRCEHAGIHSHGQSVAYDPNIIPF